MALQVAATNCKTVVGRIKSYDSKNVIVENWNSKGSTTLAVEKLPKEDMIFLKSNIGKNVDVCIPNEAFLYKK